MFPLQRSFSCSYAQRLIVAANRPDKSKSSLNAWPFIADEKKIERKLRD